MGSCFQLLSSKQRYCRSSLLLRRTLNSSQVIVHLGIKTYLNHFISECLPSPELLQPTALEAPSYQHDGYSPLSQPPTPAQRKDIDSAAKFIGAGAATVGVAGSGAGIG